jgi:hypothetical protein
MHLAAIEKKEGKTVSDLEGFPLPPTARHDEHGNHIPPHIPEWRAAAGTDRVVRGSEVERNERHHKAFSEHLNEHRRRGESALVAPDA